MNVCTSSRSILAIVLRFRRYCSDHCQVRLHDSANREPAVHSVPNDIVALNFDITDFNPIGNLSIKFRGRHYKKSESVRSSNASIHVVESVETSFTIKSHAWHALTNGEPELESRVGMWMCVHHPAASSQSFAVSVDIAVTTAKWDYIMMIASIESQFKAVHSTQRYCREFVALNFDVTDFNQIGNLSIRFRGLHQKK